MFKALGLIPRYKKPKVVILQSVFQCRTNKKAATEEERGSLEERLTESEKSGKGECYSDELQRA